MTPGLERHDHDGPPDMLEPVLEVASVAEIGWQQDDGFDGDDADKHHQEKAQSQPAAKEMEYLGCHH